MSSRAQKILARFPAHFEAVRSGKQLEAVVTGLSNDLDVISSDLAATREAHRLAHAKTTRDLKRIGALHRLTDVEFGPLELRITRIRAAAEALDLAVEDGDEAERDRLAAALLQLFAADLVEENWSDFHPTAADPAAAALALIKSARTATHYRSRVDHLRQRIATVSLNHSLGNGTVSALLRGAANALDLELDLKKNRAVKADLEEREIGTINYRIDDDLFHGVDRFLHSSYVADRFALKPPQPTDGSTPEPVPVLSEIIGLEENPRHRATHDIGEVKHAQLFSITRRGFVPQLLRLEITAPAERAVIGPMFVNRDEGHGVGYAGVVPQGSKLVLTEEGRLYLTGAESKDVTSLGFSWKGGCFASAKSDLPGGGPHPSDFVFDGPGRDPDQRPATFVTMSPADALNRDSGYPHGPLAVEAPEIWLGVTRYAFFVQWGHLSSTAPSPDGVIDYRITPRTKTAFFGDHAGHNSVFGTSDPGENPIAAKLALSWLEHQAYTVRLHLPARFKAIDDDDGATVASQVLAALERFRPAGIELQVAYQDDQWILGDGVIAGTETADPNGVMIGGTVLWPAPDPED